MNKDTLDYKLSSLLFKIWNNFFEVQNAYSKRRRTCRENEHKVIRNYWNPAEGILMQVSLFGAICSICHTKMLLSFPNDKCNGMLSEKKKKPHDQLNFKVSLATNGYQSLDTLSQKNSSF